MGSDDATQPSGVPARGRAVPSGGPRYVLEERLGEGAMGVVWRARDTQLERDVAVKLLHDHYLGGDHQAHLVREARTMARLAHPNVVAVHDAGEIDGRAFVAMELVRGESLTHWLETPRGWQEVVAVFRGVAEGLASAHAAGILHRDIKPSNILIGEEGRPRLVDFGVAHASTTSRLDPDAPLTATTAGVIGSPAYMSLQRLCGEPADASGDQFGFCVALYEALHGRRPFDAPTIAGTIVAIARGAPPPVRDVPGWLHGVVARGLAIDPDDRFSSMVALNQALAGPRRNELRRFALPALGLVALAAVIVAVTWDRGDGDRTPAVAQAAAPEAGPPPVVDATEVTVLETATVDAAPIVAATVDAAIVDAPGAVARRLITKAPPPPRSPEEVRTAMQGLRAGWKAAAARNDHREARRLAEEAISIYPIDPDPRVIAVTSSCRLGDEPRARAHMQKLPRSQSSARIAAVRICRRVGIELDDLLTELEALRAH